MLLQSNINNTRSDIAHLVRVLVEICQRIEKQPRRWRQRANARALQRASRSLMTDVPDLPNFSHFHEIFRKDAGRTTPEGDMRTALLRGIRSEYLRIRPAFGCRDAIGGSRRDRK